ncbi:hypothetical protein BS50DRAFT_416033 [Corynespora cassiicola Philippines]|uniref:Uncharacterized protein n=1 Tax=Corynespora cassiicola Philippines TaxID=1448308 RepID=A0A2T2NM29_CORCC|nr:hypothetical protein BS50DRAFT_416033 [Corynespora cassiicola Philippines]
MPQSQASRRTQRWRMAEGGRRAHEAGGLRRARNGYYNGSNGRRSPQEDTMPGRVRDGRRLEPFVDACMFEVQQLQEMGAWAGCASGGKRWERVARNCGRVLAFQTLIAGVRVPPGRHYGAMALPTRPGWKQTALAGRPKASVWCVPGGAAFPSWASSGLRPVQTRASGGALGKVSLSGPWAAAAGGPGWCIRWLFEGACMPRADVDGIGRRRRSTTGRISIAISTWLAGAHGRSCVVVVVVRSVLLNGLRPLPPAHKSTAAARPPMPTHAGMCCRAVGGAHG